MPVERRSGGRQATSIVVGLLALVVAVGLAWGAIALASGGKGPVQVRLGDDVFDAGQAARLSRQVAADGPILFSDVSGRGQLQPIFVNHFGDDPKIQWVALSARAPGAPEGCFLAWNAERNLFDERANVDGAGRKVGELCRDVTYSADGSGSSDGSKLETFPWRIDATGDLIVDLRPEDGKNANRDGG
ncbi:MAG: hypothetical protein ACOYOP_14925 [Microthrixaceae bacterium]